MKKYIAFLIVLASLLPRGTFAQWPSDFQRKLSCRVTENAVRVYLIKEKDTLKCQDYVSVLNTYLRAEYQTMLQIMSNLNRWDDMDYRKSLYETKKTQFLKLFSQRKMIQSAMNEFESELLTKSKAFLEPTLLDKQQKIQETLTQIGELASENMSFSTRKLLAELHTKQEVISLMLAADSMDTFSKTFTKYLTLFPLQQWWK